MIFLVIAILIVGGIAFAGYKIYQKFTNPQDVMESLEEIGEPVLAEDVTEIYIDDTWIDYKIMDSVSVNDEVQVEGNFYIIGNSIYIEAETLYDKEGNEITGDVLFDDYVIPHSDTVLLTNSDIAGLSLQEINYAKNEIYARHGRRFKSQELQNYFNSKSWYNGTIAIVGKCI